MSWYKGEMDLGRSEHWHILSIQQCNNLGKRLRAEWKVKDIFQSYLRGGKKNKWGEDV